MDTSDGRSPARPVRGGQKFIDLLSTDPRLGAALAAVSLVRALLYLTSQRPFSSVLWISLAAFFGATAVRKMYPSEGRSRRLSVVGGVYGLVVMAGSAIAIAIGPYPIKVLAIEVVDGSLLAGAAVMTCLAFLDSRKRRASKEG